MTGRQTTKRYEELPQSDTNQNDVPANGEVAPAEHDGTDSQNRCLRVFAHPNVFMLSLGLMYTCLMGAMGVYVAAIVSTIEKRFQLKSSATGLIISMNDISGLCSVLFVSYFGGRFHRPRVIGSAGLLVAIGTFATALPQFLYGNPSLEDIYVTDIANNQSQSATDELSYKEECYPLRNVTECTAEEMEASGSQLGKTWLIILGQLLCGIGATAIVPLSITYLDDAVEKTLLPIYLALTFIPATVGYLIGYSISGYCLSLHVDFYKVDASELGITPQDPEWQGAWWLGFIIYGCFQCLFSVPFFFFPRRMRKPKSYCGFKGVPNCCKGLPGSGKGQDEPSTDRQTVVKVQPVIKLSGGPIIIIKDFVASIRRLLTNLTYLFCLIGQCCAVVSFVGFGVFSAKYIQFEFGVDPATVGYILGIVTFPGFFLGTLLGGMVTSRFAKNQRSYAKMVIIIQTVTAITSALLLCFGCENINIAGLTSKYETQTAVGGPNDLDIYAPCNMNCSCEKGIYSPVCGSDDVTYVTACFAGCRTSYTDGTNNTIYLDCACINPTRRIGFLNESTPGSAVKGACPSGCPLVVPFLVFIGFSFLVDCILSIPMFMLQFRSIADEDREFSIGLSSFAGKLFGFIPTPIIFGAAIESQCDFFQESCQLTGECTLYDRDGLRYMFIGLTAGFKLLASVFMISSSLTVLCSRKKPQDDVQKKVNPSKDEDDVETNDTSLRMKDLEKLDLTVKEEIDIGEGNC